MRFENKIALVTGAASGIGRAVLEGLASEGASVIAADLDRAGLMSLAEASRAVRAVPLDVTQESDWEAAFAGLSRLDVFVGSAGISHVCPIHDMTLADWRRVMAVNLDGIFLGVRQAVRLMKDSGGGSIVLISSASGIKVAPGASAYSTTKAAIHMFAKSVAVEVKPFRIRVNTVSPAGVVTPMWSHMPFWEDLVSKHGEQGAWEVLGGADPNKHSLERMAFPEEIAKAVLFLSSDDAAHITATDLVIDAGYTA